MPPKPTPVLVFIGGMYSLMKWGGVQKLGTTLAKMSFSLSSNQYSMHIRSPDVLPFPKKKKKEKKVRWCFG